MSALKKTLLVIFMQLSFLACSSFAYKWYGMELSDQCYQEGKLLGPKPEDDLSLTQCKPTDALKGPCAVLPIDEFERLRTDLVTCQAELRACQQNH